MCRDDEKRADFGGGAPWIAVPRLWFRSRNGFLDDALLVRRSSAFAARGTCSKCTREVFIHYDCEPNTDWVHADVLGLTSPHDTKRGFAVTSWSRIHRSTGEPELGDGIPSYPGFEPWEPDPCRPAGTAAPAVCMTCFQPSCSCNGAAEDPRDAAPRTLTDEDYEVLRPKPPDGHSWVLDGEGAHFGDEPFLMRHGDIDAEVCVVPWRRRRESSYTALEKARQSCHYTGGPKGCETSAYRGMPCLQCRCRLGDAALQDAVEKLRAEGGSSSSGARPRATTTTTASGSGKRRRA